MLFVREPAFLQYDVDFLHIGAGERIEVDHVDLHYGAAIALRQLGKGSAGIVAVGGDEGEASVGHGPSPEDMGAMRGHGSPAA